MIPRLLGKRIKESSGKYPVVAILGPRQSGKTTLAKNIFPRLPYASLESPDIRSFAMEDPREFLAQFPGGAVLDEVQRVPELFSFIQTLVDSGKQKGPFILTGSQHFSLMEKVTQSLAGRVSIHKLLPFSMEELESAKRLPSALNDFLFTGGYPRIYDKRLDPMDWLNNYIETYLERDVRSLKNVGDLSSFHRFLRMTAYRCGQLLDLSSLGSDCGISHNTAKAWLSVLEASFSVFLLHPHHMNFNKRLIKSPKIYFYDSGLLCRLLGIAKAEELSAHAMRGGIFESFVLSELTKQRFNRGQASDLFFWQDKSGREIDCLIETRGKLLALEIKSGRTIGGDYFRNLAYWKRLSGADPGRTFLIYAGEGRQKRENGTVLGWRELSHCPV